MASITPRKRRRLPGSAASPLAPAGGRATPVITSLPLAAIKPYDRNTRVHTDHQIGLIAGSIEQFGFNNPILIDHDNRIVAGHGRYEAARRLELAAVPTVLLEHLTPQQVRAYRIADNRLAELSEWNRDMLRLEIADFLALDLEGSLEFDLPALGFTTPALDVLFAESDANGTEPERVDLPDETVQAVTRPGDLWCLGEHRILCGDALDPAALARLTDGVKAQLVFIDPPYNVPVRGHVRAGKGHREFAMASGEMTTPQFREFLTRSLDVAGQHLADNGLLMVCMDWRHISELIAVARELGFSLVNVCVWAKTNAGMGSLWRSQHELIAVFGAARGRHLNNVELGRHGRHRSNLWTYAGVNTFRRGRAADLTDHPTVKPTALVADAIRDVTRHGDIVLDSFGGSGTPLLAAQKTGRRARLVEIDPRYVDTTIRRWQELTGHHAVCAAKGERFDSLSASRQQEGRPQ